MILSNVMDELAIQLDIIPELTVYSYETDTVVVPAAIVDFPETYDYDATYGRGADRMVMQVHAIVSKALDRIAKTRMSKYVNGSGPESFKEVLEAGIYSSFDSLRVMSVRFESILIGQIEYTGATFLVDIFGVGR